VAQRAILNVAGALAVFVDDRADGRTRISLTVHVRLPSVIARSSFTFVLTVASHGGKIRMTSQVGARRSIKRPSRHQSIALCDQSPRFCRVPTDKGQPATSYGRNHGPLASKKAPACQTTPLRHPKTANAGRQSMLILIYVAVCSIDA